LGFWRLKYSKDPSGRSACFLFAAAMVFGTPFLAGYFLGRYVEMKKLKKL
jgi:hypothetical protein